MLTNETLRAIVHGKVLLGMNDVRPMAEELLFLRSIRDARDDEVDVLRRQLACNLTHFQMTPQETQECYEHIHKLRDIAIARGRTRTDAVNQAAEWAKECEALQEQLREAQAEVERARANDW